MKSSLSLLLLLILCNAMVSAQQNNPLIASGPLIDSGISKHDEGAYKEAIALYKKVPKGDTNYVRALYELGMSLTADSQFTEAMKVYETGLSQTQEREREPDLYNNYGSLVDDMGDAARALRIYDSALAKYPSYGPLLLNKATTLLKLKRSAEAEALLQKNLLMNPYSISSHYMLGVAAMQEGKIVQAFMSFYSYLMMSPSGRYFQNSINNLSLIAGNKDEIRTYIDNRKNPPSDAYQLMEQILLSKIALDKNYKSLTKLDDAICRQIQVVFEKLDYSSEDNDFWMQYYLPLYKKIFAEGKFELFINYIFSNVNLEQIQNYNKKNKKEKEALISEIVAYLNEIRETRELFAEKRASTLIRYSFDEGALSAKGKSLNNGQTLVGPWEFYYSPGNIRSSGQYTDAGERDGTWNYFYFDKSPKAIERYKNGKLEGESIFYFENGNVSAVRHYLNDEQDGISYTYYYSGANRTIEHFKNGKLEGEKKIFFTNGMIQYVENYKGDSLDGVITTYHQNGLLESRSNYNNGKLHGSIKGYYNNGQLSYDGQYENGKMSGEWKRYHENGQLKATEKYSNGDMDGEYAEFHDNGKLFYKCQYNKGKIEGEVAYNDEEGHLYSTLTFENGLLKSGRYYDPAGKQISSSEAKNKKLEMTTYWPNGTKRAHLFYNEKGEADGEELIYSPSGKIAERNYYTNGMLNGTSIVYHSNGKIKLETPYENQQKNGYYKEYHPNSTISYEGWYVADQMQGKWISTNELGDLESYSSYTDNDLNGFKTEYWPNGKIKDETENEFGWVRSYTQFDTLGNILHRVDLKGGSGKYTMRHLNGKLYAEADYIKGSLDGVYKFYFFDGSLNSLSYYKRGLADSITRQYFYGGQLQLEGNYFMGAKKGTWTYYKPNGRKSITEQYVNGELNGKRTFYFDNGKTDTEISFKDGNREGWMSRYDTSGLLMVKIRFHDELPVAYTYLDKSGNLVPEIALPGASGKVIAYYPNGTISASFEYAEGKYNGPLKTFYQNGKTRTESMEVYGESEGAMKEYYPDGTLRYEWTNKNDNFHGYYAAYNPKGIKTEEGNYYNGTEHGLFRYYTDNGQLKESRTYYYGMLIAVKK